MNPLVTDSAAALHARDFTLVQRSLTGDRHAIETLVDRLGCVPRMLSALNGRTGRRFQEHDLADLTQDVLMVLWSKLETFQGRSKIESWAYRFCFLELMNRLRHTKRWDRLVGSGLDAGLLGGGQEVETTALELEEIESSLDELGPPEAQVIRMKHLEDLTFRDIGEVLAISPNSAKAYYYRGLVWLRRRLDRLRHGETA
jgi:RNA polymerase sigma-70 factor (ECF subfamily)